MGVLIGLYALVFLGFAVVGLLVGASLMWIYAHLAIAAAGIAYSASTSMAQLRERLSRGSSRRTARYGGNVLVQTGITIAILVGVAYVSVTNPVRWDWTEAQTHSLAEGTLAVLDQIPEESPVEILAFFSAGAEAPAKAVLDRYTYRSPRVLVRYVDANADPALANRFEINSSGVLIVCAGSCETSTSTARITAPTEEELTKAIRSVISSRRKVYALTGHGEASPDDAEVSGLSQAKKALEAENVALEPLMLLQRENVPEDADAVIVAGPDRPLLDRELDALGRFVDQGGALLVLLDPLVTTNLEDRLRGWGFEVGRDVIVDEQIQLFAGPKLGVQPVVTQYGPHEITRDMTGRPTLFQLARSVRAADGDDSVQELLLTGTAAWAETDVDRFLETSTVGLDERDLRGPVSLAAARSFEETNGDGGGARIVVVGDADFARNRYIAEFYNADLLVNSINWLVGDDAFITIDRNLPRASTAVMTLEQFQNFRYMSVFVIPELILLVGIAVWWRRRT